MDSSVIATFCFPIFSQTTTRICPSPARGRKSPLRYGYRHRGGAHSKPQLQVTPSCIPQFATMKRNWWPNAGPIVERIRRGDIAQITCWTELLLMEGEGCGGDFLYDE